MKTWLQEKRNTSEILICLVYLIALLFNGGIFEWNATVLALSTISVLLYMNFSKENFYQMDWIQLRNRHNWIYFCPFLLFGIQLLVAFFAIDRSDHWTGVIKGIALLLWMQLCMERDYKLLKILPASGALMTFLGILSLVAAKWFPSGKTYFFTAERFGGFFQYANTCALFLFLGLVVAVRQKGKQLFFIPLILMGILMTGSRTILLLLLAWLIYGCVKGGRMKWKVMITILVIMGGILGIYLMTGFGEQNFARIFTIFSSNSTFWGRLLYDWDGLRILFHYPQGLGYGGYYSVQHAWQTGVYTVRFVHNDILQAGLDYGILFMLLFLFYSGWQIFYGKQSKLKKELLILILAASLIDFHLQFLAIDFLAVLCCDLGSCMRKQTRVERTEYRILITALAMECGILIIPYWNRYLGDYESVLKFFPNDTEALVSKMEAATDRQEALALAERVLKQNPYRSEAYEVIAYAAAMDGNLKLVMENFDKVLLLEKYDVKVYKMYEQLLVEFVRSGERGTKRNETIAKTALDKIDTIHTQLSDLSDSTSPLAYKIKDLPQFYW